VSNCNRAPQRTRPQCRGAHRYWNTLILRQAASFLAWPCISHILKSLCAHVHTKESCYVVVVLAGFGALTSLVKLQASFNSLQQLPTDVLHAPNLELMRYVCICVCVCVYVHRPSLFFRVAVCQLDRVSLNSLSSQNRVAVYQLNHYSLTLLLSLFFGVAVPTRSYIAQHISPLISRVAVCQLDQLPVQLTQLPVQLIHDEEVAGA